MKEYKYVAHRGLFHNDQGIPENSIPAFERALKAGLAIELDVRMTKDRKLVVIHDGSCKRMTGRDYRVSELTWQQLSRLPLLETEYHVPLLTDVLELISGQVPLLIEVKNVSWIGYLEYKLRHLLLSYHGPYMIESFHPVVVAWMKHYMKGVSVGQLVSLRSASMNPLERLVMQKQGFYKLSKPDFLSYDIGELTPQMANQLHKMGIKVYGWTVKSAADYERVKEFCDGVIFDTVNPDDIIE